MKAIEFKPNASGTSLKKPFKNNVLANYATNEILKTIENPITFERPGAGGSVKFTYGYEGTLLKYTLHAREGKLSKLQTDLLPKSCPYNYLVCLFLPNELLTTKQL